MKSIDETRCGREDATCPKYGRSRFGTKMAFLKNGSCSKTLMNVMNSEFGHPMPKEELAVHPLAGGLMNGYQCGMLWGSTLAAGAEAYRRNGPGPNAEVAAIRAATRLVPAFRDQNDYINCLEITETDPKDKWQTFMKFFVKGETLVCMRRAADYAPTALAEIDTALREPNRGVSSQPVSCAALLAEKMGASDLHATMAAGLAGGIGLSGGACGALGAAIWLTGMMGQDAKEKNSVINARIEALIDRFLKVTNYEFECFDIVERKFDTISEHAEHIRNGGCARIIDALIDEAGIPPKQQQLKRSA